MSVGCFNVVVCLVTLGDFRKVVPVDKKERTAYDRAVAEELHRETAPATNIVLFPDMSRGKCKLTMLVAAHPVRGPFLI